MSSLIRFAVVLGLIFVVASPAIARVAAIETTAPLDDHSKTSIEEAVTQALRTAVRGAMAMGLPWVRVRQALVFTDMVSVQILASDSEPAEDEDAEQSPDEKAIPTGGISL
ncbi:MAG TPA: hypothetical protein VGW35_20705 [Methylomirabilota bacterium]|nr:hypothetical protein [Methylomirabilota bacterium]